MKLRLRSGKVESYEGRPRLTPSEKTPVSPSLKAKAGGVNELPSSPILNSKHSTSDLMFQMDDEASLTPATPTKGKAAARDLEGERSASQPGNDFPALGSNLAIRDRSFLGDRMPTIQDTRQEGHPSESPVATPYKSSDTLSPPDALNAPWGSSTPANSRKDLKEIMAETSQTRQPGHAPTTYNRDTSSNFASKLSQKERKKLQQQQAQEILAAEQQAKEASKNPWKTPAKKHQNKEPEGPSTGSLETKTAQKPAMTLRQTVAGTPPLKQKTGPTPSQTQSRVASSNLQTTPKQPTPGPSTAPPSTSPNTAAPPQPSVQSIRHIPRPEPQPTSFHSPSSQSQSLASIFMQQQTEKNEIHDAATAKHNLQDIQLEQEFQEWWDKESRRVQGQAATSTAHPDQEPKGGGRGRGKGQQRSNRKGGGAGGGTSESALTQQLSGQNQKTNAPPAPRNRGTQQRIPSGNTNHALGDSAPAHQSRRGNPRGRGRDRGRKP